MAKNKFLYVFGTRPEAIKLSPLILESQKRKIDYKVCFTGQHAEMATPILNFFKVKPDYDLQLMTPGQTLNGISLALFQKLIPIIQEYQPTHLIVQGDTTSAAVAALMGFYEKIQIVHIEAGLRTYNMQSPWPEEFNRRLIGIAASWHFAPTEKTKDTLLKEGVSADRVFNVGNTVIDALRMATELEPSLQKIDSEKKYFRILVTLHRRESFGSEMRAIMGALKNILVQNETVEIIWPLHQNPQVREAFKQIFTKDLDRLHVTEPLGYIEFINEMKKADLIVTDSGGVQEEAPFLAKPVLVCRNNTERQESIDCGSAKLIGTDQKNIISEIEKLIPRTEVYQQMAQKRTPYGNGYSSAKILDLLN